MGCLFSRGEFSDSHLQIKEDFLLWKEIETPECLPESYEFPKGWLKVKNKNEYFNISTLECTSKIPDQIDVVTVKAGLHISEAEVLREMSYVENIVTDVADELSKSLDDDKAAAYIYDILYFLAKGNIKTIEDTHIKDARSFSTADEFYAAHSYRDVHSTLPIDESIIRSLSDYIGKLSMHIHRLLIMSRVSSPRISMRDMEGRIKVNTHGCNMFNVVHYRKKSDGYSYILFPALHVTVGKKLISKALVSQ